MIYKQEAQLMLTCPRDAFRGHARSSKVEPFDRLGMVYWTSKMSDLEIRVKGHLRSLKVVPIDRLGIVSY